MQTGKSARRRVLVGPLYQKLDASRRQAGGDRLGVALVREVPEAPVDAILSCVTWEKLDDLFRPTADNLIEKVDKRLGTRHGSVFSRTSDYKPRLLKPLMIEYDEALTGDEKFGIPCKIITHFKKDNLQPGI